MVEAVHCVLVFRSFAFEFDSQSKLVHRIGIAHRVVVGNRVSLVKVEQSLVESLHAEFGRLLHDGLDLVNLTLENQILDERRIDQDLDGKRAAVEAVLANAEPMGPSRELVALVEETPAKRSDSSEAANAFSSDN